MGNDLAINVLLIDDEEEFVLTLSERLESRGIGSKVAFDGSSAISMLDSAVPDVIVLDLKMPGMDGIEVLRRIKKKHPELEVIILTGHGAKSDRLLAEDLGAFAYLNKPVDIDVLADTMKQAYAKLKAGRDGDG